MDRLTELELFVTTAELGTLSKAAEMLGLSNAAASRHLVALEQRLNVRLIDRNTRRLALTHSGHQFYTSCKSLLGELKEAEASLTESLVQPVGTLTITSSISFCMLHIAPLIPAFRKKYPHITVKVLGENRYYDIIGPRNTSQTPTSPSAGSRKPAGSWRPHPATCSARAHPKPLKIWSTMTC
ncbi:HTH-type transcriptional regulator DmlR [compost metagenome]